MNILFIHQNFPGQFKFLAPALARKGNQVRALTMQPQAAEHIDGIQVSRYTNARGTSPNVHPWVSDFETKVIRAQACFEACLKLKSEGFTPDLVISHHGWGESMFVKDVWPQTLLALYCEFFYHADGADVGFDQEFIDEDESFRCKIRLKNANNLLHFQIADSAISPTKWQASTFPESFRSKINVIHDGIDTQAVKPNAQVKVTLVVSEELNLHLTRSDEVITFVNRNLEPLRGFHVFMRALPLLLQKRPKASIVIVGGDGVSYGSKPKGHQGMPSSWKDLLIKEVRPHIDDADWQRVHFLGNVSYEHFLALMQISSVHVYLTYPFVLSWSLLEAMSAGCAIVASDTQPVREVIKHKETGILVDFFDVDGMSKAICRLLDEPEERKKIGALARQSIVENYDLGTVCLPKQLEWVDTLLDRKIKLSQQS